MVKTRVILNPVSGNGAGAKLWPSIEAALRSGGLDFDLARTTAPREATSIAEKANRDGYVLLITVGGDGIVHEVVNGLMRATNGEPNGTLGVIPVGSGNDFAKMIPLRSDWREGVQRILGGKTRWFDVGKVVGDKPAPGIEAGAHYFANGLDTGFGALVAMHAHEVPYLQGTAMYLVAILKTLANYYVPRLKIELADHTVIEQSSTMAAVSIGRCYGGGFWLTPTAEVDDGLFDIMIGEGLGRMGILSLLPKVMKGTHVGDPRVKFVQSSRLVIESPDPLAVETDGEIPYVDAHRLEIEILPKRLRVIC
jgi:YegS/Rv2252/BmrU family lipid kinase